MAVAKAKAEAQAKEDAKAEGEARAEGDAGGERGVAAGIPPAAPAPAPAPPSEEGGNESQAGAAHARQRSGTITQAVKKVGVSKTSAHIYSITLPRERARNRLKAPGRIGRKAPRRNAGEDLSRYSKPRG